MRTLFAIISLLAVTVAYSQNAPQITVSSEKVKVNGNIMYVHKVKGGETLYSLAKAYKVTIDDIVRQNETLKNGLKEGSIIYIPSSVPVQENTAQSAAKQDNVATGDTVQPDKLDGWYLSGENIKKYSRKKHKAKGSDTIEKVADKYGVSVESIMAMNSLKSTQLKKKQVIYIPNEAFMELLKEEEVQQNSAVVEENQETVVEQAKVEIKDEENAPLMISATSSLTYILPLNLKDTLGPNANFMDFYAGALVAVDTLKKMGHSISIRLVDEQMEPVATDFGTSTIIGPVMSSDMSDFLPVVGGKNTVISPMDLNTGKLVAGNRNFVQIAPDQEAQMANLIDLLASKSTLSNSIMMIYEKNGADLQLVEAAKRMANDKGLIYNTLSYDILEGREMMEKIMEALEPGLDNLVLIPSNSEAFVSDVVRNLNLLYKNPLEENRRSVILFGTSRWRNFETIEVEYFHKMNLHLSIPYYVDYSKDAVKEFLMKYRALYNCEPTPFAFQGFDITMMCCGYDEITLQSKYRFKKDNADDGLKNTGTTNIVYNKDYTISVIE